MRAKVRKSVAERYMAELEGRDVTVPSGYVFKVRGMSKVDFAEILAGLPSMSGNTKDEVSESDRKRSEELERTVYTRFVDGLVDEESGEVEPVPFDKVLTTDMDVVLVSAMKRGKMVGPEADSARRAL